jgi:hypothetical protein
MKLQTAKAGLWLVALAMSGTTVAAAQISPAQASSPISTYSSQRNVPSVLSPGKPSEAKATTTLATAEPSLPDAPSAVAQGQSAEAPQPKYESPQPSASRAIGPTFLVANGALFGSTIANAAEIGNCRPSACQAVPQAIRSRGTLYAIGIPASLGVTYISYRLKRSGTRWWIAPVALFTAGNIIYAAHAAHFSNP